MKHGSVTSTKTNSSGLQVAKVSVPRAGITYKNCPVSHTFEGEVQSIEEGNHVLIEKTDDGIWVVMGVLSTDSANLPSSVNSQERVMKFDDGTEISVTESGGTYDVSIDASGDTTLNASGSITIGDATNAESLAVQAHTHDYDDTGDTSDGTATATTKQSTQPKEAGTTSTVE